MLLRQTVRLCALTPPAPRPRACHVGRFSRLEKIVLKQLTPAAAPPASGFSTQPRVLDFDLGLDAVKETRFSPQRRFLRKTLGSSLSALTGVRVFVEMFVLVHECRFAVSDRYDYDKDTVEIFAMPLGNRFRVASVSR
jgi:hypothetical protein